MSEQFMDHAARQALEQLARQLEEPLREELSRVFMEIFRKMAESMEQNVQASLMSLKTQGETLVQTLEAAGTRKLARIESSLKQAASACALIEGVMDTVRTTGDAFQDAAKKLLPQVAEAQGKMEEEVVRFAQAAQALHEAESGQLAKRLDRVASDYAVLSETLMKGLDAANGTLNAMEERSASSASDMSKAYEDIRNKISRLSEDAEDWSGALRAAAHAQTKELSDFSVEFSEFFRTSHAQLLDAVDQQIAERDSRVRQEVVERGAQADRRLRRVERWLLLSAGVLGGVILLQVTALLRL
jgi:uncharacterized phage infection (PIP) family protein YhgE